MHLSVRESPRRRRLVRHTRHSLCERLDVRQGPRSPRRPPWVPPYAAPSEPQPWPPAATLGLPVPSAPPRRRRERSSPPRTPRRNHLLSLPPRHQRARQMLFAAICYVDSKPLGTCPLTHERAWWTPQYR